MSVTTRPYTTPLASERSLFNWNADLAAQVLLWLIAIMLWETIGTLMGDGVERLVVFGAGSVAAWAFPTLGSWLLKRWLREGVPGVMHCLTFTRWDVCSDGQSRHTSWKVYGTYAELSQLYNGQSKDNPEQCSRQSWTVRARRLLLFNVVMDSFDKVSVTRAGIDFQASLGNVLIHPYPVLTFDPDSAGGDRVDRVPGSLLLAGARRLFPSKWVSRVLEPVQADFLHEYAEALSAGDARQARILRFWFYPQLVWTLMANARSKVVDALIRRVVG